MITGVYVGDIDRICQDCKTKPTVFTFDAGIFPNVLDLCGPCAQRRLDTEARMLQECEIAIRPAIAAIHRRMVRLGVTDSTDRAALWCLSGQRGDNG